MHNSFISIVTLLETGEDIGRLRALLSGLQGVLEKNFSDYEIILVNNKAGGQLAQQIEPLPEALKQNIYLLNLSNSVDKNHAVVAGLDRANGDYTLIFETEFFEKPQLVLAMYEETLRGFDIVYLRARGRQARLRQRFFYRLFYWILHRYSSLKVDRLAHDTRIISRRALNSLLRLRENVRYMKAIYALIGYPTSRIVVDEPLREDPASFTEKFRTSLVAITSFTTFLRSLLMWIFITSIVFLVVVIVNAVKVKLTNVDLFGGHHETMPGWTFLVVASSIFFALTCFMLYIMSIYLANIYQEIKHRPPYIIESIKRF